MFCGGGCSGDDSSSDCDSDDAGYAEGSGDCGCDNDPGVISILALCWKCSEEWFNLNSETKTNAEKTVNRMVVLLLWHERICMASKSPQGEPIAIGNGLGVFRVWKG